MRNRIHKHYRPKCTELSAKDERGYERLLAAIYAPFPEEATMHYLAARPISDDPKISPNSCVWGMVEQDPRLWN